MLADPCAAWTAAQATLIVEMSAEEAQWWIGADWTKLAEWTDDKAAASEQLEEQNKVVYAKGSLEWQQAQKKQRLARIAAEEEKERKRLARIALVLGNKS